MSTSDGLSLCEEIYEAAAHMGFLQLCEWRPSSKKSTQSALVSLQTTDRAVLNQLTLSAETTMTYPDTRLTGLKQGEVVKVADARFQVREVVAIGDGTEMRATLTRL